MLSLLGLAWLGYLCAQAIQGRKSQSWPIARGVIDDYYAAGKVGGSSDLLGLGKPTVRFSYTVGSVVYVGTRYSFGPDRYLGPQSQEKALAGVVRFRPGDGVDIRFNPHRPDEAVLVPGVQQTTYLQGAFAFGLVVVGLLPYVV